MGIEALYIVGIVVIIVGLGYGLHRSRSRNRANDQIREEATRELYENPDAYMAGGRQKLQNQLKSE